MKNLLKTCVALSLGGVLGFTHFTTAHHTPTVEPTFRDLFDTIRVIDGLEGLEQQTPSIEFELWNMYYVQSDIMNYLVHEECLGETGEMYDICFEQNFEGIALLITNSCND